MDTESLNPLSSLLDSNELPPFLKDLSQLPIDASTQTEETSLKNPEKIAQAIPVQQLQHFLKTLKPEPFVSFLGGKYFFKLAEDLSSNIGTRRMIAYDLWRTVQDRQEEMQKRLIIFFESQGETELYFSVCCFDFAQHSVNAPNVSHQLTKTIICPPYSTLTASIRQLLANELICILLLLNYKTKVSCAPCSQSFFQYGTYIPLDGTLLLKCMHIYHIWCINLPINENEPYFCPCCKTAIKSEEDYILYKKQI